MRKIKTEWFPTEVIQLLSKVENKLLDWDNKVLDLSLAQRVEIRSIFDKYEDYYLYDGDKRGKKMFDIKAELIEKIRKLKEKYDIQQKKIDDAGYSEDDLGNMLSKAIEQYPVLDRLWVREQLWSKIRGLEEVIQII